MVGYIHYYYTISVCLGRCIHSAAYEYHHYSISISYSTYVFANLLL